MKRKKYQIKKSRNVYVILGDKDKELYSTKRHFIVKPDNHPWISGFSKIADCYSSYDELLKVVNRTPATAIRNYWENVGTYVLDAVEDYDK